MASFTPTSAMRDEAQQGLDWRQEFGRGGTAVGVARARDIINGDLSFDTVKRMSSYFARHLVDKDAEGFRAGEEGFPSAGRVAWALTRSRRCNGLVHANGSNAQRSPARFGMARGIRARWHRRWCCTC